MSSTPEIEAFLSIEETLLTIEEAAILARCSVRSVRRACADHGMPFHVRPGSNRKLFLRDELVQWLTSDRKPSRGRPRRTRRAAAAQPSSNGRRPQLGARVPVDISAEAVAERRRTLLQR